jgi:hypothetical protein
MAGELIVCGATAVVVGMMLAKRRKKTDSYRDILRASAARAYAYQQSLIIEAEMREEAMNKLSIYEQEVIKKIEDELKIDNFKNNMKMEADKAEIIRMRYRNFLENTPEYKEMLKKYPEYKKSKN